MGTSGDEEGTELVAAFLRLQRQWSPTDTYCVMRHQLIASCTDKGQAERGVCMWEAVIF